MSFSTVMCIYIYIYIIECSEILSTFILFFSYNYNSQGPGVAVIVGSIIGCILLVLVCVTPILCFLCPCCLLYKVCRKKRNRTQQGETFHWSSDWVNDWVGPLHSLFTHTVRTGIQKTGDRTRDLLGVRREYSFIYSIFILNCNK